MTEQYATYTRFYSPEHAQFLVTLLQQHNIPYAIEHEVNQLDRVYIGDSMDPMFALQVPGSRFNEVNALLAEQAKSDMKQPGFESQLQTYSVEELQEILREPAGWSAYDIQVAKTLLMEKVGESAVIEEPKTGADTWTPVKLDKKWIVLGYIACFTSITTIFYLSLTGFFAGLAIIHSKKTLPNGTVVKLYTEEDIRHGKNMIVLGLVFTVVFTLLLIALL